MSNLPEGTSYQKGKLHFAGRSVAALAEQFDTPLYVYSEETLEKSLSRFPLTRPGVTVCYTVKANNNLELLSKLNKIGASFDVASLEELRRVVTATQTNEVLKKCVATGPVKSVQFLKACLAHDVFSIHAESEAELARISSLRESFSSSRTRVALRVNPDVIDETGYHHLMTTSSCSKFGVSPQEVLHLADKYSIQGLHYHIGSRVLNEQVLYRARDVILRLLGQLEQRAESKSRIEYVDIGGSLGVSHGDGQVPFDIPRVLDTIITPFVNRGLNVYLEPGRSIVAQSAVLLTRVEYTNSSGGRHFALVDATMTDFIRPAVYGGYHRIVAECEPPSVSPSALVGQLTTACASSVIHSNGQATYLCHWGASHDVVSKTASIDRRKADGLRQASGSPGEERRPVPSPRSTRRLITTNRDESNNNSSIITNKSDSKVDSIPSDLRGSRESLDGLLSEMQGSRLFKKQQTPSVPPMPSPRVNRRTSGEAGTLPYDVVGPVCECADFLGLQCVLPVLHEGDLLAVADVGAYGYSMASNYNSRCRPAQVMVLRNGDVKLLSRREMLEDQLMLERNLQSFEMT
ncbi:uncharacterized protein LOC111252591 isoform X1 [Varroa destructor]|uniref:Diaminopimelate decarboxylase n=1 Tax=Varroa destructor TaxID=109461 RepID=A0A7M7KIN0_VARDE|nr:uncharacterized protein LOC111252591 isoform X1 [Varroa destructor]